MSDILLAQPVLGDGWVDLSVGEPNLIRDNLLDVIDINSCLPQLVARDFIYPSPCGEPDLVKYLEDKHGAKVIVTNGAKQALGACFYALKKMNRTNIGMRHPYWALIPPLAKMHDVRVTARKLRIVNLAGDHWNRAELILAPNNPDGSMSDIESDYALCKQFDIKTIHDAAYYTGIYLGPDYKRKLIGDVQVFSMSKMLGLSSLRVGYAVCQDNDMYNLMQDYMENMTVGVSKLPQMFLLNIFKALDGKMEAFENKCFNDLRENKLLMKQISPTILEVLPNAEDIPGMFLWAKCNDIDAFKRAKLHVVSGKHFGDDGYLRLNLAFKKDIVEDIVTRLNAQVKV